MHQRWKRERTSDFVLEEERLELRVNDDPDVEEQARADNDDEDHPSPIADVKTDEKVGRRDRTGCDGCTELPDAEVVSAGVESGRGAVNEEGDEERDGGLIESVEHEAEEDRSGVLLAFDAATIKFRICESGGSADILIELSPFALVEVTRRGKGETARYRVPRQVTK